MQVIINFITGAALAIDNQSRHGQQTKAVKNHSQVAAAGGGVCLGVGVCVGITLSNLKSPYVSKFLMCIPLFVYVSPLFICTSGLCRALFSYMSGGIKGR
tara:strand:- start:16 stop:315 length:300 start_codon:yes stop_codon:yes gene_type:complete